MNACALHIELYDSALLFYNTRPMTWFGDK